MSVVCTPGRNLELSQPQHRKEHFERLRKAATRTIQRSEIQLVYFEDIVTLERLDVQKVLRDVQKRCS